MDNKLIKTSYGIICIKNEQPFQILMVKKLVTYHYCEFINGNYKKQNNDNYLINLFNNMTYHEKMDILNMDFKIMWYRIYKCEPKDSLINRFLAKKNKFEKRFLGRKDNLKKLMSGTKCVDTIWEFPKGKKDNNELNIETAIREFNEETYINSSRYNILWWLPPYIESYMDYGTTYKNIYYFAEYNSTKPLELKFYNNGQTTEIYDIQWVSKNDIPHMKMSEQNQKRLLNRFDKIHKKYKNYKKSLC